MEIFIRIIKITVIAVILYLAYFFLVKESSQNKPDVYSIDSNSPERIIESPKSIIGMTFTFDEKISIYFENKDICQVTRANEEDVCKIKGTPHYSYKKENSTEGTLNVNFILSREKGKEIVETEYRYQFELKYSKPSGGKANCNYVIIHKIGIGDRVKSYIEADMRPIWFELK